MHLHIISTWLQLKEQFIFYKLVPYTPVFKIMKQVYFSFDLLIHCKHRKQALRTSQVITWLFTLGICEFTANCYPVWLLFRFKKKKKKTTPILSSYDDIGVKNITFGMIWTLHLWNLSFRQEYCHAKN